MSRRELQRAGVLARVKAGGLRLKDTAELMRIGYRQAKRLWKRYQAGGLETRGGGAEIQPRAAGQGAEQDPETGAGEIQRRRAEAFGADAGGGASGERGRA